MQTRRLCLIALFALSTCKQAPQTPPEPDPPVGPGAPLDRELLFTEIENRYDLAHYCEQMTTRHAVVRAVDMVDGGLRWRCGDIPGFTGEQHGQEYCEYQAVSNGRPAATADEIDLAAPLYCVFTSVFNDTVGRDGALATALAAPENLGAPITDLTIVRMQKTGFNARVAADGLIGLCSEGASTLEDERQAACFHGVRLAFNAGETERAADLELACRGLDLTKDANWQRAQALGARQLTEGEAGFQEQREIIGCMIASPEEQFEELGITDPLNSDSTICGRTFRAGAECGCNWSAVPPALDGFLFTEWLTPTNTVIPPECRLAKVDGQDYPHLMLCEVPAAEVTEVGAGEFSEDLKGFCDQRFGQKLGMFAPLRAIEIPGTCRADTEFCAAFTGAP